MARMQYPSISDIAGQVLRDVAAEDRVKTAEAQVLRDAQAPVAPPRTELAEELHKLASACRNHTDDVTYGDLKEFLNAE